MTCDDADDVAVILKKNTDHRQVQKKKIVSVFQLRASTRDGFQQVILHAFTTTTKRRRVLYMYVPYVSNANLKAPFDLTSNSK